MKTKHEGIKKYKEQRNHIYRKIHLLDKNISIRFITGSLSFSGKLNTSQNNKFEINELVKSLVACFNFKHKLDHL